MQATLKSISNRMWLEVGEIQALLGNQNGAEAFFALLARLKKFFLQYTDLSEEAFDEANPAEVIRVFSRLVAEGGERLQALVNPPTGTPSGPGPAA